MKVRLTLERPGRRGVDLSVTCDANTKVGDLAQFLKVSDPANSAPVNLDERLTIGIAGSGRPALDPDQPVVESELRSGQLVTIARAGEQFASRQTQAAAVLRVVEGPDAGTDFPLSSGSNIVGRGRSCQVRLKDPMVSRAHARINVTDTAEIIDLGSANGLSVNDEGTDRRSLRTDDLVQIGDTVFSVRLVHLVGTEGRVEGTDVAFIRSPRLAKVFKGRKLEAPEPPEPQVPGRFPFISLLAPILMAAIMYSVTQNLMSLLFIALSPIMLVGSYLEQRFAMSGANKAALKLFRADLADFAVEVATCNEDERQGRLLEHPSVGECVAAVDQLSPLLWTRRTDSPGFGEFRLGLGTLPTRHEIELPSPKRGPRHLHAEIRKTVDPFWVVHGVPVVASPGSEGGMGVCGPRQAALAVARSIVVQALALHSPTEMVLAAVLSDRAVTDWDFLKWFPHNGPMHSPLSGEHLAATAGSAAQIVADCEELIRTREEDREKKGSIVLPTVFLLVESDAPVDFSRLVSVAERGWHHGVYVLWVAPELAQLPASCRTFVDAASAEFGGVGYLHTGDLVTPVQLENLDLAQAMLTARRMAPVTDLATRSEDSSDLPRSVSWLNLVGLDLADRPDAAIERWVENRSITVGPYAPNPLPRRAGNLRGVLGQNGSGLHSIDLRVDGPHALVGGTTGSGKSELLQTWILSMAAANSPQRLTFLLVDYKGGSAFAECNRLPHTVGLVTDLNPHGVVRALNSLAAELRYREHLLEKYKAKDLVSLEKAHPEVAPPSLVIVVDEFAALVQEVPEFVDGVVNVAQRGRSLGLHLILATQRPAGVIKGNLRANTNLRIALRVADADDSNDVIDSPMAAYFDQELPGRAVAKTGPGRYISFQTGYVGGHTSDQALPLDLLVEELSLMQRTRWESPIIESGVVEADPGPTDIARIVENLRAAHVQAGLPEPRKPWLPELRSHYTLGSLPTPRRDDCLVFGLQDDADNQSQPVVAFYPDRQGNMAIFGTGGSGKSTLLRTLAAAAGFTVRGGPCHVYGLDFGSRALAVLEDLPHVGSIVAGSDDERVKRLITWLRSVVDQRSQAYQAVNASTIGEYRRAANRPDEPRILLLIDGVAAFRTAYEGGLSSWLWEMLISVAAEGRPVGVHVVVTADRMNAMSTALSSAMQAKVVLRMSDQNDYSFLGVPTGVLTDESTPGRGMVDGREVQVAMLGRSPDSQAQAVAVAAFAKAMAKAGMPPAPEIRRLPEVVPMATLPAVVDSRVVIGQRSDDLGPWTIDPKGAFVVTGPPGSGRTTTLAALHEGLRRAGVGSTQILFTPRNSGLSGLNWRRCGVGVEAVAALAAQLSDQLRSGPIPEGFALFVESIGDFVSTEAEQPLTDLVKILVAQNLFVVAEGEVSALTSGYSQLLNQLRAARAGLALQPESGDGAAIFKTDFPARLKRGDFPPGRGLLVGRSKTDLGQIMDPGLSS